MAVVPLQKVRIVSMREHVQELIEALQRRGVIELREADSAEEYRHELHEGTEAQAEYQEAELEFAIRFLKVYDTRSLSFREKAKTGGMQILSDQEMQMVLKDARIAALIHEIEEIELSQQRLKGQKEQIGEQIEGLQAWMDLPGALNAYTQRKGLQSHTGIVRSGKIDEIAAQLQAREDVALTRLMFGQKKERSEAWQLFVQEGTGGRTEVESLLDAAGFENVDLPESELTVAEYRKTLEQELARIEEEEKQVETKVNELAQNLPLLEVAYDQACWQKQRLEKIDTGRATEKTAVFEGFIRERDFERLKETLEQEFAPLVMESVELKEDEQPPVTIENNALFAPFEAVTRIYGLPKPGEPDPTPFLSPFFAVYFALCLTDAAYGAILAVLCIIAQFFFHLGEEAKKLVRLIMIGGIFTSIIGVFFGGWFGIEQSQLPQALRDLTLVNPLEDVLTFLGIAAGLGFIQLIAGLIISVVWKLKMGDRGAEVWGNLSWILLLLTGAAHVGVPQVTGTDISTGSIPLMYFLAVAVAFFSGKDLLASKKEYMSRGTYVVLSIVLAPIRALTGILGLYGIIGYVSDILSYSRLLALGLSTGIVALAINIIAALVNDMIPYVGIVFAILVLIGGHAFNIVNNVLGAYIHSGRLQFVEFFPKFLEGGGEEWKPLVRKGKYVEIKDV